MSENQEQGNQPYSYRRPSSSPYKPFIYSLILAFGVMLGFIVNTITIGKQPLVNRQYNKMEDIMNYISLKYVDTVNRTQLMDKTIDKMLSNLDPHSVYIPAKDVSEMNENLEGNFEGIGIEFFVVQDTITVVTAIAGGPSELAGIKAGDRIISINDTVVAGKKIKDTDVKKKLRGPKGSAVKVAVLRSGRNKLLDLEIVRDRIPLYSVDASFMLNNNTGYIKISNFSATTHMEFVEKLHILLNKGMQKLVIDLRGNPGGYLQAATSIADELIDNDKVLVYTKGKAYDRQDYNASKIGIFEKGDVSVLIDQGSASASEILAGAIQDWDRGTIVGRTSFGKGLVQEQYELRDGSALRLTVARYYTPSGRCIQRAYDKGTDDYYNEVYERYMRGEFIHEDTINKGKDTTVYKTAKGRRVYGGGGIHPDLFVPLDTSADNEYFYSVRAFVPEFVYKYTSQHSGLLDEFESMEEFKQKFVVSDALLDEFYKYAEAGGLKRDKVKDAKITNKIKINLRAFIAKQSWRLDGYYYIINDDDKVVSTAASLTSVSKKND